MDRTEVNASPVQKAPQGIKKYKYVLLTALLGVLLLLLPQNEKAADSGSATPSAAENFDREALQNEMEDILSSLDGVGKLSLMLTVEGGALTSWLRMRPRRSKPEGRRSTSRRERRRPLCSAVARAPRSS